MSKMAGPQSSVAARNAIRNFALPVKVKMIHFNTYSAPLGFGTSGFAFAVFRLMDQPDRGALDDRRKMFH